MDCTGEQRVEFLEGLKQKSAISSRLWIFNQLVRKRAIQGYRESQYVMTHLNPHRMIPEKYDGYYPENDSKMEIDSLEQLSEMFDAAGFSSIKTRRHRKAPGIDIHEMGGVRMGRGPKTSLLNKWNQLRA